MLFTTEEGLEWEARHVTPLQPQGFEVVFHLLPTMVSSFAMVCACFSSSGSGGSHRRVVS
jgi:hypothetical protein